MEETNPNSGSSVKRKNAPISKEGGEETVATENDISAKNFKCSSDEELQVQRFVSLEL